ncbi:LysR substrate-binding domain-containing protein [Herbaspirillum sp. GCM10030257]|uniref:LysR substrate-binding domain-containing protein n=1 Tax=Herbaspirillum sp. GCM10030257 TaxID=3273393 RepID=UPI0036212A6D
MSRLPPLRSIQVFETLGRCSSMTEAARRLNISPGAVSQQIKILEDTLGLTLLIRQGASLELTAAGKHFYESCAGAFESLRVAQDEISRVKDENSLTISALPSLMTNWLSPLVYTWQQDHPGLNVYLDGAYPEPLPNMYDVDFRITYGDMVAEGDNAMLLYSDCVVPACSPKLLKGRKTVRRPDDILLYPLLSVDWAPKFALPPSWSDWFVAHGVESFNINERYRVFSLSSMAVESAVRGHGFVLAQYSMIAEQLASGELLMPIHAPLALPTPYYLKWSKSAFDKGQCRHFHRWIVAKGREQSSATERLLQNKRQ